MTEAELWQRSRAGDNDARKALATKHYALVHFVARKIWSPSKTLPFEDMIGAGSVGLMQAIDGFDPGRGLKFTTFAIQRIRGAILDSMREEDHLGRTARKRVMDYRSAQDKIAAKLNREPTTQDLQAEMNISSDKLRKFESFTAFVDRTPLEHAYHVATVDSVQDDIEKEDEVAYLLRTTKLTRQERECIQYTFYEKRTNLEIGRLWGVSESRVAQVYKKAIMKLRKTMKYTS